METDLSYGRMDGEQGRVTIRSLCFVLFSLQINVALNIYEKIRSVCLAKKKKKLQNKDITMNSQFRPLENFFL